MEGKPRHVHGICDLGQCEGIANWAYSDGDIYIEVCGEHAEKIGEQFDSDYQRVEHGSPFRDEDALKKAIEHDECGGTILVFRTPEGNEHRVCDTCDYGMLVEHTGERSMRVRHTRS